MRSTIFDVRTIGRPRQIVSLAEFALLLVAAELAGRSLIAWIDLGRHVAPPSVLSSAAYHLLLAAVKVGLALAVARLGWRLARARASARAAERVLAVLGHGTLSPPRLRPRLSPLLWAGVFASTSAVFLLESQAAGGGGDGAGVFAPLVHTAALPVFAVLAVLVVVVWSALRGYVRDCERYAEAAMSRAGRLRAAAGLHRPGPFAIGSRPPRRLFGLSFQSRPPPLLAL